MHLTELEASEAAGAEKEPENWVPRHFAERQLVEIVTWSTLVYPKWLFFTKP